ASLQRPEGGPPGPFLVRRLPRVRLARLVPLRAHGQSPHRGVLVHGTEHLAVHHQPECPGAARVRLEGRDPGHRGWAYSSSSAPAPTTAPAFMPRKSFTLASISVRSATLSLRNSLAFSRPW